MKKIEKIQREYGTLYLDIQQQIKYGKRFFSLLVIFDIKWKKIAILLQETVLHARLSFSVEWYQEEATLMRQFLLNFFPYDKSVEMVKMKKKMNINLNQKK